MVVRFLGLLLVLSLVVPCGAQRTIPINTDGLSDEPNIFFTGNLGQLYERLPKTEADGIVDSMLEQAGYNQEKHLLADLGAFSAPSLQHLDQDIFPLPGDYIESSYALGALPLLRDRGAVGALISPREMLLNPQQYLSPDTESGEMLAGNIRNKKTRTYVTGNKNIRTGSYRLAGVSDLRELTPFDKITNQYEAEKAAVHLKKNGGVGKEWSIKVDENFPSPIHKRSGAYLINRDGEELLISKLYTYDKPFVVKFYRTSLTHPDGKTEPRYNFTHIRDPLPNHTKILSCPPPMKFDKDLAPEDLPKKMRSKVSSFSQMGFDVDPPGVDVKGWHEAPYYIVNMGIFGTLEDENFKKLVARVDPYMTGGKLSGEERQVWRRDFLALKTGKDKYRIIPERALRYGSWYLSTDKLKEFFGEEMSLKELEQKMQKIYTWSDLMRPYIDSLKLLEAADTERSYNRQ